MRAVEPLETEGATAPLTAGTPLDAAAFAELRRRMIFDWGKWDPQIEDQCAMSPVPLVLSSEAWAEISGAAERSYTEAVAAELEVAERPELLGHLGLGRALRRALSNSRPQPGPRVIRFDFHLTSKGWAISEGNTDVPGGFIEAAGLASCYADLGGLDGLERLPTPAEHVAECLTRNAAVRNVALVHASAYTDDRQVMRYLATVLSRRGVAGHVVAPDQLSWSGTECTVPGQSGSIRVDALFRFFPVEWLPELDRSSGWSSYFTTDLVQLNPCTAAITQSKRFPLIWDQLRTPLPTWRTLLPETRDPREVKVDDGWVLKPAMGRVGEDIVIEGVTPPKAAARLRRWARWLPGGWAAQRRFEAAPVETPQGSVYPVIGVFVVDGKACGVYGRAATRPLVDKMARDCAVFVEDGATRSCDRPGRSWR